VVLGSGSDQLVAPVPTEVPERGRLAVACGVKPECLADRWHPDGSGLIGCKAQRCTRRQNGHEEVDAKGEKDLRQDQESFCKWVGMVSAIGWRVGSLHPVGWLCSIVSGGGLSQSSLPTRQPTPEALLSLMISRSLHTFCNRHKSQICFPPGQLRLPKRRCKSDMLPSPPLGEMTSVSVL